MKRPIKNNNPKKHQPDRKIIQLLDLTELNDQESELLVGGGKSWGGSPGAPVGG